MAVDTALKRSSVLSLSLPAGRTLPPPHISLTGAISAQDRAHVSRVYPGFWSTGDEGFPFVITQTSNTPSVALELHVPGNVVERVLATAQGATRTLYAPPLKVR